MGHAPKNTFIRNSRVSDTILAQVVYCWWLGFDSKSSSEWLSQIAPTHGEKPIGREAVARLYDEIGDRVWLVGYCAEKLAQKIVVEDIDAAEAIRRIKYELSLYYQVVRDKCVSDELRRFREERGASWSPLMDYPVSVLVDMYTRSRGFPESKMPGLLARIALLGELEAVGWTTQNAARFRTQETLNYLSMYPLRTELPRSRFPWIDLWESQGGKSTASVK